MDNSVASSMSNSRENLLSSSSIDSEYTYENAIEDYKSRISRTPAPHTEKITTKFQQHQQDSKVIPASSKPEINIKCWPNKNILKKQENLLRNATDSTENKEINTSSGINIKKIVPTIDIKKKKQLFELKNNTQVTPQKATVNQQIKLTDDLVFSETNKDHLKSLETKDTNKMQGHLKDTDAVLPKCDAIYENTAKLNNHNSSFEGSTSATDKINSPKLNMSIFPLKDRLSTFKSNVDVRYDNAVTSNVVSPTISSNQLNLEPKIPEKLKNGFEKTTNEPFDMNSNSRILQNYKSDDRCVILKFNCYDKQKNVDTVCKSSVKTNPIPKIYNMTPKILEFESKMEKNHSNVETNSNNIMKTGNNTEKGIDVESYNLENGLDDYETSVSFLNL